MLSKKNFLLSVTIIFLLSGCSSFTALPTTKAVSKSTPAWIDAPLPYSENYMYGIGIESNRKSAIKAALNDMIAKLGITIESSYESYKEVQGAYLKSTIKNQIKADISKIKINNYKVVKSHKSSYREFAVMIETDKQKLLKGLKDDLQMQKKSITQKYVSLSGCDALKRYNTKKELSKKANKLLSKILIIAELDKNFNKQENLNFIIKKQKEFLAESKKLKFYVSGNKKSVKFVDNIKNFLTYNGFNISNSKKNAISVKIKTTQNISKNSFIDIAVLTLKISVFDKSKQIGGKSLILKERYNGSIASVYKNASIHLNEDIKSLGINEAIGINLKMD